MKFVGLISLLLLLAPMHATADEPSSSPEEKVWHLNAYLNGTTEEVRTLINGEVERLTALTAHRRQKIDEQVAFIAAAEQAIVNEVRASAPYRQLAEQRAAAEQRMQALQASDDLQARMDASSRFNKTRLEMEALERQALRRSPILPRAREDLARREADLKRVEPELAKAQAWRDKLLEAMREKFKLRMPLRVGDIGILARVAPKRIIDADSFAATYIAAEFLGEIEDAKKGEGIRTISVRLHELAVVVNGIDTSNLEVNEPAQLDQTFRVNAARLDTSLGRVYVISKTPPSDLDALFAAVNTLREIEVKP